MTRPDAAWISARDLVLRRANWGCEAHAVATCTGRADHVHHVLRRSQGGKHDPALLLAVCHLCHGWIHDHPAISYDHGWLKRSGC